MRLLAIYKYKNSFTRQDEDSVQKMGMVSVATASQVRSEQLVLFFQKQYYTIYMEIFCTLSVDIIHE